MDRIGHCFSTSLTSGEVLLSTYWLHAVPIIIVDRELYVNLVVIDMCHYDVILGMDFLRKYNAAIECRKQIVAFEPEKVENFEFVGEKVIKEVYIVNEGSKKSS